MIKRNKYSTSLSSRAALIEEKNLQRRKAKLLEKIESRKRALYEEEEMAAPTEAAPAAPAAPNNEVAQQLATIEQSLDSIKQALNIQTVETPTEADAATGVAPAETSSGLDNGEMLEKRLANLRARVKEVAENPRIEASKRELENGTKYGCKNKPWKTLSGEDLERRANSTLQGRENLYKRTMKKNLHAKQDALLEKYMGINQLKIDELKKYGIF